MASRVLSKGPLIGPHTAGIYSDMTVDGEEIGTLVVVVDRAKNLPNRKTMGKQDPYCAARLGKEAKKTETDKRGGQTPRWDQELRFTVHESPDYYNLKVSVFNDDKRTDLIGETWVNLEDVVVLGGGKGDKWHNLNCKGKYAGEIRIELTYYDTRVSSERQASEGMLGQARAGSGPGGSPAMAGPRQQSAVRRRPLPADPNNASPAGTPDRATPNSQPSFGPRSYNTPPHQRPLPASNSPSGFAIRDTPVSSPASLQQDQYQRSELPAEYGHQYDDRSNYGYEEKMHDEYHDQREISPYSLQYADDGRSVHPSEQGWSDSHNWNHQQQPNGQQSPFLPHSHSAPSVPVAPQDYHAAHHSAIDPYAGSERGYDQSLDWPRDQSRSPLAHSPQPTVEDEYSAPPPPPPAHRNSAPTLLNHRSTPNLNSSTDMRAYAAHRHRMSVAENSPQNSPAMHSPQGNQGHRGSPHAHGAQSPSYSTPTRTSRDMVSYNSPQSSLTYQRPQYTPGEITSPVPSPHERQTTPNSVPLIKPRAISPATQSSPIPAPLRQSGPPTSSHSTPTRKSVSPHPTPPGSGLGASSGTPFSPDSFDAFNPAVKGRSPVSDMQQTAKSHSPSQPANPPPRKGSFQPVERYHRGDSIVTPAGHVVDPSDHLPADSWAPEPERKGPKAASEIGAEERSTRASPRGAQPMVTVRTKAGGATTMPMTVNRKPYTHPSHVSSAPAPAVMETPAPLNPHPNPPAPQLIQQREAVGANSSGGGRNRLVKKSRPLSIGAPDIQNRGAPSTTTTASIPLSNYDNFAPHSHQQQQQQQQQQQLSSNYENFDRHAGYDDRTYGAGMGYRGAATAAPPPIPAKIPLQPYVEPEEPYMADPEMQALSEEMKRIDIGPTPGMGVRGGGRVRRSRFGP